MKHKTLFCLSMTAVMAFSVAALAACGEDKTKDPETLGSLVPTENYVMPTSDDIMYFNSDKVHVHDPSIFYDEKSKTYYAFGSHYAVASSPDLIEWTQEVSDGEDTKLFGTGGVKAAMPETMQRASNQDDVWAPDVEYYNGKYYMYVAFTQEMYTSKSVISRVESDNVLGPYGNETILLESISSAANASGNDKPNCIDAELFYDKEGKLWMVYGSFFGGIYIKELYNSGSNWGLPKEEEGWGTLIWRNGYSAGVEGPFIFYNPLTEYYYLMTSEDDLNTKYNMRIARSEKPDGPYVDITGNDVATADGHGNKVAGNYKFARQVGNGYSAMGHNSVVQDPKTGNWFVVYHTRRLSKSNHNIMVSQLYFNEDKWPVMAPSAYVGESFGKVTQAEAAGDYELILHSVANDEAQVPSEDYTLNADGTVKKGAESAGSWTVKQDFYVEITLGEEVYKGVIVPVWDIYSAKANRKGVLGITAVNAKGNSLWALGK